MQNRLMLTGFCMQYSSFSHYLAHLHKNGHSKTRLVMMGGHDPLCKENVEHLEELKALSEDLKLSNTGDDASVIFMVRSFNGIENYYTHNE